MKRYIIAVAALSCWSCASGDGPELLATTSENGDEISIDEKRRASANTCATRWTVLGDSPDAQSISYAEARSCVGRATQGAQVLSDFIQEHFSFAIHAARNPTSVEIYNCRRIANSANYSLHSEGRALDIYIEPVGGEADNRRGDLVANWLASNAAYIGIQYIIWDRTSWRGSRSPQSRCYTGAHPHHDHIHVELTKAAARGQTQFFIELNGGSDPTANTTPIPMSIPQPKAWLGAPCETNEDCATQNGQASGFCFRGQDQSAQIGFCSAQCDGVCSDRNDAAPTFCVAAAKVGGQSGGLCVAKAHQLNENCDAWDGFESRFLPRYVGASNVRAAAATVCISTQISTNEETGSTDSQPDPGGQPSDSDIDNGAEGPAPSELDPPADDQPQSANGNRCEDPNLPLSEHNYPCEGIGENTWRCACSERFDTPVSQVCRNGAWVNYELDPRDCSRCAGDYSSGCEP